MLPTGGRVEMETQTSNRTRVSSVWMDNHSVKTFIEQCYGQVFKCMLNGKGDLLKPKWGQWNVARRSPCSQGLADAVHRLTRAFLLPCGCMGPALCRWLPFAHPHSCTWKSPTLGSVLCCHHLEILPTVLTDSAFAFCAGPHKSWSQSCLPELEGLCWMHFLSPESDTACAHKYFWNEWSSLPQLYEWQMLIPLLLPKVLDLRLIKFGTSVP